MLFSLALVPSLWLNLDLLDQKTVTIPKLPRLAIESYRLQNGLQVVLHEDHQLPRVTVCMAYHVGSKNERQGRTGFAHFFEHMMFRGTKHVPNFDLPLVEAGSTSNAFTTNDLTVYYETVPSNFVERALYLEADRLAFLVSALSREKFDTEREVVKNERRQMVDNVPYGLAEEAIAASLFPPGHPYSWSIIGSMDDLNSSSLDDLREFFFEYYHPTNACLCLAGDFSAPMIKPVIEKYFGVIPAGAPVAKLTPGIVEAKPVRLVQYDVVERPRVYWNWIAAEERGADAPALDILSSILGDGQASRLYGLLIDDLGIASDVNVVYDAREIGGIFSIDVTVAEGHHVAEVEKVMHEVLDQVIRDGLSLDELERAQAKLEKSAYSRLTSTLSRALVLATGAVQYDQPDYYRENLERYFAVNIEDLQRVAQQYLTSNRMTLEIHPVTPTDPKSSVIQGNPIADGPAKSTAPRSVPDSPVWECSPEPAAEPNFSPPQVVSRTLSTGLQVHVVEWHTLPLVQVELLFPVGTADDPSGFEGLATLATGVFDQGTQSQKSTAFAEELERLGVQFTLSASDDWTTIDYNVSQRHFLATLARLHEILVSPRFDQKDFKREQELQIADIQQGPTDPNWIARRATRALLYGATHPYGKSPDGTEVTVKSIKLDDLKAWHKRYITANGAHLLIVGDVDPEAVFAYLETAWKTWQPSAEATIRVRPTRHDHAKPGRIIYLVNKSDSLQSIIRIGRPWIPRRDPSWASLTIANRAFGDDFLCRINSNLRERNGYTYGAASMFSGRLDQSLWLIGTSVQGDSTAAALREILLELNAVRTNKPLTPEEITTHRGALVKSYPENFEGPGDILVMLRERIEHKLPESEWTDWPTRLKEATPEQIQQGFAALCDPDELVILIVGDANLIKPQLETLHYGSVVEIDRSGRPVGL